MTLVKGLVKTGKIGLKGLHAYGILNCLHFSDKNQIFAKSNESGLAYMKQNVVGSKETKEKLSALAVKSNDQLHDILNKEPNGGI